MKIGRLEVEIKYRVFLIFALVFILLQVYGYFLSQQKAKPFAVALMFHSVSSKGPVGKDENGVVITPEKFTQDIRYLKQQNYNFIDYSQLIDLLGKPEAVKANSCKNMLLTFDDGYRDNYFNAYPILKDEGVKANINIVAYYVEHPNFSINGRRLPNRYLSWKQINEMKENGIIHIGSHSYNSHNYTKFEKKTRPLLAGRKNILGGLESEQDFQERVTTDLLMSRQVITARTGKVPEAIAFPFGWAAPEAKKIAGDLGFKIQIGIKPGLNYKASDLQNLRRITVKNSYTPEQLGSKIRYYIGTRVLLP